MQEACGGQHCDKNSGQILFLTFSVLQLGLSVGQNLNFWCVSWVLFVLQVVEIQLLAVPSGTLRIKSAMSAQEVVPAWSC